MGWHSICFCCSRLFDGAEVDRDSGGGSCRPRCDCETRLCCLLQRAIGQFLHLRLPHLHRAELLLRCWQCELLPAFRANDELLMPVLQHGSNQTGGFGNTLLCVHGQLEHSLLACKHVLHALHEHRGHPLHRIAAKPRVANMMRRCGGL